MTNTSRILVILLVLLPLIASAQTPFMGMEAAVEAAGAPDWLKEGVRISFRLSTGTPNETGDRLASAAQGVLQLDVSSLAKGKASGLMGNWGEIQPSMGAPGGWALVGSTGFSTVAGFGEFWVHPKLLDQAIEHLKDSDYWKAGKGPYQSGGKSVDAVMFTGTSQDGRLMQRYVYDARSGIALFISTSQRKNPQGTFLPVSITEFLVMRQRQFPWLEGRPPSWLTKFRRYVYDGRQVTSIPNAYETQIAARVTFDVSDRGPNWIAGQMTQETQGYGSQSVYRLSGSSATNGFWLPPLGIRDAARQFRGTPIEIDRDPITGATVQIVAAGQGQHGRNVVTIQEQTPGYVSWADFEIETGVLILFTAKTHALFSTYQVWLTGLE